VPAIMDRSILGAFGASPGRTDSTASGDASISRSVSRLGWQPISGQGNGALSCLAAMAGSAERTCSRNSRRPPGASTRVISLSAACSSGTLHSVSVVSDGRRVVRQVQPGACADFDRGARGPGEQVAALLAQPGPLGGPVNRS
jgi:hypothetical protein